MRAYEKYRRELADGMRAVITDIQRFTVHDGPGIRTMVFFKGCPLRCQWCQNPETWHRVPELMYHKDQCIGCGNCERSCTSGALRLTEDGVRIDGAKCRHCGACAENCFPEALKVAGRVVTVDEVYETVIRDRVFYETSGGGVTLSGGECTTYDRFVTALLARLRADGIHTAIETCGFCPWEKFSKIVEQLDLVLFDVKVPHPLLSKLYTGQDCTLIYENLRRIRAMDKPVILRYPMIPGVNDTPDMLRRIAEIASENRIKEIHLLPFHQMGSAKWHALARDYSLETKEEPTEQEIDRAHAYLRESGLLVSVGGSGNVA